MAVEGLEQCRVELRVLLFLLCAVLLHCPAAESPRHTVWLQALRCSTRATPTNLSKLNVVPGKKVSYCCFARKHASAPAAEQVLVHTAVG